MKKKVGERDEKKGGRPSGKGGFCTRQQKSVHKKKNTLGNSGLSRFGRQREKGGDRFNAASERFLGKRPNERKAG